MLNESLAAMRRIVRIVDDRKRMLPELTAKLEEFNAELERIKLQGNLNPDRRAKIIIGVSRNFHNGNAVPVTKCGLIPEICSVVKLVPKYTKRANVHSEVRYLDRKNEPIVCHVGDEIDDGNEAARRFIIEMFRGGFKGVSDDSRISNINFFYARQNDALKPVPIPNVVLALALVREKLQTMRGWNQSISIAGVSRSSAFEQIAGLGALECGIEIDSRWPDLLPGFFTVAPGQRVDFPVLSPSPGTSPQQIETAESCLRETYLLRENQFREHLLEKVLKIREAMIQGIGPGIRGLYFLLNGLKNLGEIADNIEEGRRFPIASYQPVLAMQRSLERPHSQNSVRGDMRSSIS
ncbi:MAG TPA: hypothetical protein VGZ00_05840 [Candidatus Baltobacteraceae bacterium]|nr:hypothetical protein [Candidatus Baltobacteraceae bacterium]